MLPVKDLGTILTHNLSFQKHIECVVSKSLKVLSFLNDIHLNLKIRNQFTYFISQTVRFIIKYGSPIFTVRIQNFISTFWLI